MKKMDKFKNKLSINKKVFTYLLIFALVAFILGAIFILFINQSDKELVKEYIQSFIQNINKNNLNNFINSFVLNIGTILAIWLLGISVVGIPVVLLIFFVRIFAIGFTLSSFILTYGFKGTILSITHLIPTQIIMFVAYTLLLMHSIVFSIKIINSIIKKESLDFKKIINKYFKILIIVAAIVLISLIYDAFILPIIIKQFISIFI